MSDRVLVTGATGFLGGHLCRALVERGCSVTGLRRPSSEIDHLDDVTMAWETADVLDRDALWNAIAGHDRVYHLAGLGLMDADEDTVRRVNVDGTRNVLDVAHAAKVERLLFVGTAGTRRSAGVADETDHAPPLGAYQESKTEAERLVAAAVREGLDCVIALPTSVFGPGDEAFTGRLLSQGADSPVAIHPPGGVSFVGVADVVEGVIAAMNRGETGEDYLLAGENLSFGDGLATIAAVAGNRQVRVGVPSPLVRAAGYGVGAINAALGTRFFPVNADMSRLATADLFYSAAKARDHLGYEYAPFEEQVVRALAWHRGDGDTSIGSPAGDPAVQPQR